MSTPKEPKVERWFPQELSDMLREGALKAMRDPEMKAAIDAKYFDLACRFQASHKGTEAPQ